MDKPNVLVILTDEQRWDTLGVYGNKDVRTPHLDALAGDGVLFSNFFAVFPVCTPSRYSLLSGLYVHQHMGWTNQSTLPSGLPTFPRVLRDQGGYTTKCVGKMHFTPTYLDVGFDEMVLSEQDGPGRWDDEYHRYLEERGLVDATDLQDQVGMFRAKAPDAYRENFGTQPSNLPDEDYSTTWIGNQACQALEGWEGGGHLLEVGFIKPHHPFDAPPPWNDIYDPDALEMLPGWTDQVSDVDHAYNKGFFENRNLTPKAMRGVLAQYYASITQIDHEVGRMVKILKDKGFYDDTLIIFTSDHGDYMGFHHMILKNNYMYDPVIQIPLVIKYPAGYTGSAGTTSAGLVSNLDLAATIMDIAGCMIPTELWGMSQPVDPEDPDSFRETVFAETDGGNYMVRTATRKLLCCKAHPSQFFDLEKDPHELENQIDNPAYSTEVQQLRDRLFAWLAFEASSPTYLHEEAPVARGKNVPTRGDGHEERSQAYFQAKMQEWQDK